MRFFESIRQIAERKCKSDEQDEQDVFHTNGFYSKVRIKSTWAMKRAHNAQFMNLVLFYVPSLLKTPC